MFLSLPVWGVIPEVVESSPFQQPVEVIKGVPEAPEVGQSRGMIGGILEHVHHPIATAGEVGISRARCVASAIVDLCSWLFVGADASAAPHEASVAISSCIACNNAPDK